MSDPNDIKERVKAAVNLADLIKRDGVPLAGGPAEFKALCPFHSEKSPSFTVFHKDGSWGFCCFGCGEMGDVFSWVMRRKSVGFMDALKCLAADVGIALPVRELPRYSAERGFHAVKSDNVRGEFDSEKYRALLPDGEVWRYLTAQRRLEGGLLAEYSIGETQDGEAYSFAYKWRPSGWPPENKPKFEFVKVVKLDRPNGKKIEWRDPKGGKNILFGMCAPIVERAHAKGGELIVCEGEIDAITWAQYGWPAVSVPGGAGFLGWIQVCWDWLTPWKQIHLSFDEDRAGRSKVMEVVKRLGISRTDIVRLPERGPLVRYKDANECLLAGIPPQTMEECVRCAEVVRPEKLKEIYDFEEEIWEKFFPDGTEQMGLLLPWGNHFGSSLPFRFRYGELTVWTGYNKHGKSEVLNHVIIDLCWQGEKAVICSLEVGASETYRKLIRMAMGMRNVIGRDEREQFREKCLAPLADKIWVYDHVGNALVEDVLNVMLYAYQRYGCRQFVLDSLMKFEGLDGDGQDIWTKQRDFMHKLLNFAATYGVHVHLVAHSKKPGDRKGELEIPRRYDIMGSSYISNLAFNVIVIWRNRAKQDRLEEIFQHLEHIWMTNHHDEARQVGNLPWKRLKGAPPPPERADLRETWSRMLDVIEELPPTVKQEFKNFIRHHDAYFIVDAQRGGDGDTPARHLWFEGESLQFIEVSPWDKPNDPRAMARLYAETKLVDEEVVA